MSPVNIDWNSIRPLNGARSAGFEELCAQLARAERPADSDFERKGAPDAGVECYTVLRDGTEWGWQSKYFDTVGDSQWAQLDDSVKTAIEKHPRLVRYFICFPLDLSDARIDSRKSARERWNDHIQKWTQWASERGMAVEFVYWGSYELLDRLSRPQHVGRVRFWFDVRGFDGAWFSARLEEARLTAGPRYTPEVHVDLPIAGEFDAFGRTERFFNRIKRHARTIRDKVRTFEYAGKNAATEASLDTATTSLVTKVEAVLAALAGVEFQPIGPLPFSNIVEEIIAAEKATEEVERLLSECEQAHDAKPPLNTEKKPSYPSNPFREQRFRLYGLSAELKEARQVLTHADRAASGALMLLRGRAGTGKTHLLCDVARQRVAANQPTVLLLGQRFVTNDAPWAQVLQQLDLSGLSAEEFVGALESAAQAAGSRALVLIDAINEGAGRIIWPSHLAAFLVYLERSPWIGVVLSVRSSYEKIVVPDDVRKRAVVVTHHGFEDHEYDAARTFFVHYGLELPSTPILAPEFSNPLFLKTLCVGLHMKGERRLPRGFSGITAMFDLYLSAINDGLASALGYDARTPLVRQALEAVSKALVDAEEPWLTLAKAGEIVNALLPSREFERSLYRGLVVEGLLIEEAARRHDADREEVVFLAYDRLADHLVAKIFLDRHLDANNPASAFTAGGPLGFIADKAQYVAPGLLEAMCIQIPERSGQELIALAPPIMQRWEIGDAFRQSLVWRALTAFTDGTGKALNQLCRSDDELRDTLDVLLTVATVPGNPLNATFLDKRLRKDTMAKRDAWWSTYLHTAWGNHGAVDRFVDWASAVTPKTAMDDETLDLCTISLAWMLSTSNRPLRDHATKALVSLLTGRLEAAARLLDRFAAVDDPYVAERLYAVAYGCAMRSYDAKEVGQLAQAVYVRVFKEGSPPAHILLRDYARGVVEHALYLGSKLDGDPNLIRPPYQSTWPHIPTEEEIEPLKPNWDNVGGYDSGDLEWSRNRIGSSVLSDDFARYVIGTNSSVTSWLSLRRDEPKWQSPDERLATLTGSFTGEETAAWRTFDSAERALKKVLRFNIQIVIKNFARETEDDGYSDEPDAEPDRRIAELEQKRDSALKRLVNMLTQERAEQLRGILAASDDVNARQPPRFDLRLIQRYVLWRVFDLGWTTKGFGHFDRFNIGYGGREASKAERIGKKYQWIAYHEISALVADHFQYRSWHNDGGDDYVGAWQDSFRDIDPSCTLQRKGGERLRDDYPTAWWGSSSYHDWNRNADHEEWVRRTADLPSIEQNLIAANPQDGSKWLNFDGSHHWKQPVPDDLDPHDVDRREIWYIWHGYLLPAEKTDAFMSWAEGVDFWNGWMPEPIDQYKLFLGEHVWSPAAKYFERPNYTGPDWIQPDRGCPTPVCVGGYRYLAESSGFDCSIEEGYTLRLPCGELVRMLDLKWSGSAADFIDNKETVVALDPTAHSQGPSALLVRQEKLLECLQREGLSLCWTVIGEKRALPAGLRPGFLYSLRMSGAYTLGREAFCGFLNCTFESGADGNVSSTPVETLRAPRPNS